MQIDKTKIFYGIIALLFTAVLAQGYFIYDLKKETLAQKDSVVSATQTMPVARYASNSADPFIEMQKIQEKVLHNFGDFNAMFANDPFFQDAFTQMSSSPTADIQEKDKEYIVKLEIPGADEKKIDIKRQGTTLSISAQSEKSIDTNSSNYIHKELYSQHFQRSFVLPQNADLENIQSDYKQGILTLKIPKKV